jgi:exosome complex component CSL4
MNKTSKKFVMPGDVIGTTEEYIAGDGTYETDGKIYSASTGYVEIDTNAMSIKVKSVTSTPVVLKPDDIVYGTVSDIKGGLAVVEVAGAEGKSRSIASGSSNGSLHISKVQDEFIKDIGLAVKTGDIIRAKVIQAEPSLQLTTKDKNLGVIISKCLDCAQPLERDGINARCPGCKRVYAKKLAEDYGNVKI